MASKIEERLQLMDYGPFDLPKKDRWIIVGSGPTSDHFDEMSLDDPHTGTLFLGSVFRAFKRCDVAIQGHYEDVYLGWNDLHKCDVCFIANPLHVGYRCIPTNTISLFNYEDILKFIPNRIRWFEKEIDLQEAHRRSHTLFCRQTIASTALHLLWKNGVKDIFYCGIDGGNERGSRFNFDVYRSDYTTHPSYTAAAKEFVDVAHALGVSISQLESGYMKSRSLVSA